MIISNNTGKELLDLPIQLIRSNLEPSLCAVIPASNAERTIARTIKSALAQAYRLKEIIVVDNRSTDNTSVIIGESGAIVQRRRNGSLSAARNARIRTAADEWIALLDADDSWQPDTLRRQVETIKPSTILAYIGMPHLRESGDGIGRCASDTAEREGHVPLIETDKSSITSLSYQKRHSTDNQQRG